MSTSKEETNPRASGYQRISPQSIERTVSEHSDTHCTQKLLTEAGPPTGGSGTTSCDLGDLISSTLVFIS